VIRLPKCPKCHKEIEYLNDYSKVERRYFFTVNEKGEANYEDTGDDTPTCDDDDWECPECQTTLFTSEEEATDFLMGKYKDEAVKVMLT